MSDILKLIDQFREKNIDSFVPILPLMFNLQNKPYTLERYYHLEPLFDSELTPNFLLKTARQVGKSFGICARGLLMMAVNDTFNVLYILPSDEHARRLSTIHFKPLLMESSIRSILVTEGSKDSVRHRSFGHLKNAFFSFTGLDPGRIRGYTRIDQISYDECQDIDGAHIPIVEETMSASNWKLRTWSGTPLTRDNLIEKKWQESSMAEWAIPCRQPGCKKLNIASIEYDLLKMLGPYRSDISADKPAIICARCGKPIFPQHGRWLHRVPSRRKDFPGLHIPQPVLPGHCFDRNAWRTLIGKQAGQQNYTTARFYNEVLGESYDLGAKLVTQEDLQKAADLPWVNRPNDYGLQVRIANSYPAGYRNLRVMGVDWGGGGYSDGNVTSFTTACVAIARESEMIDIIYGIRLLTPSDHALEAEQLLHRYMAFNCNVLAHDFNGAGSLRESLMTSRGVPQNRIARMVYSRTCIHDMIVHQAPTESFSYPYYRVDKARVIQLVCRMIQIGWIRFFKYDRNEEEGTGLLDDFLALIEVKKDTANGGHSYSISHDPNLSDDFAHAVVYACCAIWHQLDRMPKIGMYENLNRQADISGLDVGVLGAPWAGMPELLSAMEERQDLREQALKQKRLDAAANEMAAPAPPKAPPASGGAGQPAAKGTASKSQ